MVAGRGKAMTIPAWRAKEMQEEKKAQMEEEKKAAELGENAGRAHTSASARAPVQPPGTTTRTTQNVRFKF